MKFFEILMDEYIDRHSPEAREKKEKDSSTPGTGSKLSPGFSGGKTKKPTSGTGHGKLPEPVVDTADKGVVCEKGNITPGTGSGRNTGTSRKNRGKRDAKKHNRHISKALIQLLEIRAGGGLPADFIYNFSRMEVTVSSKSSVPPTSRALNPPFSSIMKVVGVYMAFSVFLAYEWLSSNSGIVTFFSERISRVLPSIPFASIRRSLKPNLLSSFFSSSICGNSAIQGGQVGLHALITSFIPR